ncbi:MAG: SpoIIE family protein phosphatase [Acidobacteriota bacterium]
MKSILENVAAGIVVCDEVGKLLCFNREAERILGMGRRAVGPAQEFPLARVVEGQEVRHELMFVRNPRQPNGVWISVSSRPFVDRTGRRRGAVAVFRDVIESERVLRAGGASQALAPSELLDSLDRYRGHYERLCRAVEQTADAVLITDHKALIEYVNPAFERTTGYSASEVLGRNPRMLKSGQHDEEFYAAMWKTLLAGQPFRGAIVNRKKSGELYWAEQTITPVKDAGGAITHYVSVMQDVTEERKRREQEFFLRLAREVQQRFHHFAEPAPGYDVAGSIHPAALIAGDYFDVLKHPDGRLTIAIGDVSGHGFGAALVMAETRAYVRAFLSSCPDPAALLSSVNLALAGDLDGSQYITLVLARLDPQKRTLEYASAGHVPGYLLDRAGGVTLGLQSTGPPLGLFSTPEFSMSGEIPFEPGDTLVLLTDGVTEAANADGAEFGTERALAEVRSQLGRPAREMAEGICATVREFCGGAAPSDDITAVVCQPAFR